MTLSAGHTSLVIDFHFHVVEPTLVRQTGNRNVLHGWGQEAALPPDSGSLRSGRLGGMVDAAVAIADMDRLGIDVSVLSASMVMQNSSWASPSEQAVFEARSNDHIAERVAAYPDRFVGLATLPLKNTERAIAELERAAAAGLHGVNLPASVDGDYLGAPRFHELWEAVAGHELVAFVHPDGARDPWFQQYALWNSVGQPIEEAKALASLILEGVLERWSDLKLVVSHGGGYLPHYVSRLDRNVTNMPGSARNLSAAPSEYLERIHFDTCVYDVGIVEALVERYGAHRLVLGSDYPIGETDPVGFIRRVRNLDADGEEAILGGTAARLLLGRNRRG